MKKLFIFLLFTIYMFGNSNLLIAELEVKLIENESDHKTRLDLAKIYFELGMLDEAKEYFETVLVSNPPQQVEKNIAIYLDRIEKMKKSSSLVLFAQAGYGQDSNVNANPGEDKLLDFMAREYNLERNSTIVSDEISDSFMTISAGAEYENDFARRGFWSFIANGFLYSQSFSSEKDYDILFTQATAGVRYKSKAIEIRLPLLYGTMQYGGEQFMTMSAATPSVNYLFSKEFSLYMNAAQTKKTYDQEVYASRDSTVTSVQTGAKYIHQNIMMGVGIGHESEVADKNIDSFVNRSIDEARLDAGIKLPLAVALSASYLQRAVVYEDKILTSGSSREDSFTQLNIIAGWTMSNTLAMSLKYSHLKNDSDYIPAEYIKNIYSINLNYRH